MDWAVQSAAKQETATMTKEDVDQVTSFEPYLRSRLPPLVLSVPRLLPFFSPACSCAFDDPCLMFVGQ